MWVLKVRTAERRRTKSSYDNDCTACLHKQWQRQNHSLRKGRLEMLFPPRTKAMVHSFVPALPELDWPCFTHVAKV